MLQNRKVSSQRAHKQGLKRELSQKLLPVPQMLNSINTNQLASKVELSKFNRFGLSTARAESEVSRV